LGNQLFCYAAARRLALVNSAELVIDDVTGFVRDRQYKRKYGLDKFHIPVRKATSRERMEPFERYRRGIAKFLAKGQSFHERRYIEQEGFDFDPRLLDLRPKGTTYIDGLWQCEKYFKDVEAVIRQDLRLLLPQDAANKEVAEKIRGCNSICVHMRWFGRPESVSSQNMSQTYYSRAVECILGRVRRPHFFLFSDDPVASRGTLPLSEDMVTYVNHNYGSEAAYADIWLMQQCRHFIIANSTFSWWGAWLAESESKIVIAPKKIKSAEVPILGFHGPAPEKWVLISTDAESVVVDV
jgi:hypothetical protein